MISCCLFSQRRLMPRLKFAISCLSLPLPRISSAARMESEEEQGRRRTRDRIPESNPSVTAVLLQLIRSLGSTHFYLSLQSVYSDPFVKVFSFSPFLPSCIRSHLFSHLHPLNPLCVPRNPGGESNPRTHTSDSHFPFHSQSHTCFLCFHYLSNGMKTALGLLKAPDAHLSANTSGYETSEDPPLPSGIPPLGPIRIRNLEDILKRLQHHLQHHQPPDQASASSAMSMNSLVVPTAGPSQSNSGQQSSSQSAAGLGSTAVPLSNNNNTGSSSTSHLF